MGRTLPARSPHDDATRMQMRRTLARLAAADADLRAEFRQEASGPEELIRLVTGQIEETVLPRSYALTDAGREVAWLSVSNRRLMALELVVQDQAEGRGGPSQSAAQVYAHRLHGLATGAVGPMRLHLRGRASGMGGGTASCSARALAESFAALGRDGGLQGFFDLVRAQSLAWLCCDGALNETGSDGPAEILGVLRALWPEQGRSVCPKVGHKPACTVIAIADGRRAFIATDGADCLLAMVPESGVASLVTAWRTVHRPAHESQTP